MLCKLEVIQCRLHLVDVALVIISKTRLLQIELHHPKCKSPIKAPFSHMVYDRSLAIMLLVTRVDVCGHYTAMMCITF